jgi:hypothetical protein
MIGDPGGMKMASHRLNKNQKLRGIEKAVRSKRTPPWLKPSMKCFAKKLRQEIASERGQ